MTLPRGWLHASLRVRQCPRGRLRSNQRQRQPHAHVPGRCSVRCRRSRLISRVRPNSPRTRLLASNRMMLRQRCTEARFQPQCRKSPLDSLRGSAQPQCENLGHFTSVCHSSDEIRPPSRQAESFVTRTMKLSPTNGDASHHRPTGRSASLPTSDGTNSRVNPRNHGKPSHWPSVAGTHAIPFHEP